MSPPSTPDDRSQPPAAKEPSHATPTARTDHLGQIWQAALGTVQRQATRQEFDTWLRGTRLLALDGAMATIGASSPAHKEGLESRYLAPVRRSLGDVVGYPVQVRIVVRGGP